MAASSRRTSQHGRLGAFEQFVRKHQNMVYNVACRILGDQELACGVTQATFYRSFQAFSEFRGESARLWLMRLVTNVCHDHLRREPVAYRAASANGDAFQAHLNKLPLDQRIALVLSDFQGLSYGEIAQVTGLSVGIVSSRLNRGRVALRDVLLAQGWLLPAARP